ncbi:MAG: LysR family transcriptional regulator [Lachnospiraceae bacterium]|nr:LysR family transcriptional regulator [Lachnospiraceae bacterium]
MHIDQLKYFINVAETLNFSEAARRSGLTQPTISHHINDLERQLGCTLFERSRHNVEITAAGEAFLPYAIDMVQTAEKSTDRIRQLNDGMDGHLSIAALTSCSELLSACLKDFSKQEPNVTVDITFNSGRMQALAIHDDKYDFLFTVDEMTPESDSYSKQLAYVDRLCVVFPEGHPLVDKPLDFSLLENERYIGCSDTDAPAMNECVRRVCEARGYSPKLVTRYDRPESVILSVGAGLGISIIPEALKKVFYSENCVFKPIEGDDAIRKYVIVWPNSITNPAARSFLSIVQETLRKNNFSSR